MELIHKYFEGLTEEQIDQFTRLKPLYEEWNSKINVISRKDIDNLYERHVLHSLTLACVMEFQPGARVLDLGTGGGFPGIPLAIFFPEVKFTLIDGTRKKITVVNEVKTALGLKNVTARPIRSEDLKGKYDFVICRAVASIDKLMNWSRRLISQNHKHPIPNGLLTLKGGNLKEELTLLTQDYYEVFPLSDFVEEPYFEEKSIVYVQG